MLSQWVRLGLKTASCCSNTLPSSASFMPLRAGTTPGEGHWHIYQGINKFNRHTDLEKWYTNLEYLWMEILGSNRLSRVLLGAIYCSDLILPYNDRFELIIIIIIIIIIIVMIIYWLLRCKFYVYIFKCTIT